MKAVKLGRAILSGIVGGVIVVAAVALAGRLSGSSADLCTLAGVALTGNDDMVATLAGGVAQLIVAVAAALVYAAVFEWVTRRAGTLIGLAVAVAHVTIAGLAVGFLPTSRVIRAGLLPPGAFMEYRGLWVVVTFVLAHLAFGALVGAWYGETRRRAPTARIAWRDVPRPELVSTRRGD